MTMKMRKTCSAAAIFAVMACSAVHAQVLGGNVGGALNGTLGGGLRDSSVLTSGNANGSFGSDLDAGSITHSTTGRARGVTDEATRRAHDVGSNVRNRTESTVAAAKAAKSEHVDAKKELVPKVDSVSSDVSGSGNASASRDGIVAEAAADATSTAGVDAKKQAAVPVPAAEPSNPKDTSKL
jgi:hypothetical protein